MEHKIGQRWTLMANESEASPGEAGGLAAPGAPRGRVGFGPGALAAGSHGGMVKAVTDSQPA